MSDFGEKVKNQFQKQRWAILIFDYDGLEIRRITYNPKLLKTSEKNPIFFKNVSEKNFRSKKNLKFVLNLLFFPFKYKIGIIAPQNVCHSKYFSINLERRNRLNPIQKEEISHFFSQNLWKFIEINKKEFSQKNGYDDLGVVLANNWVSVSILDKKTMDNCDDIFGKTGKKITFGILQTFISRNFLDSLSKMIPVKRATLKSFHEYGFQLPFSILMAHLKSSKAKNKKFIFADIKENETRTTLFDGESMFFLDVFNFGSRSLYEAVNHFFGIDYKTYLELLDRLVKDNISKTAKNKFLSIFEKELSIFNKGISSFKKETKAGAVYINGEYLSDYLNIRRNPSNMIIFKNGFDSIFSVNLKDVNLSNSFKADLGCMLGISRNEQINMMIARQIRWLIPQGIEVN